MAKMTFWNNVKNVSLNPVTGESFELEGGYDSLALLTPEAQLVGTVASANQANRGGRGVEVVVDITTLGGTTPNYTVVIEGLDPLSGKYYTLLTSAALAAVATTVLTIYPGVTVAANLAASRPLPPSWRVKGTTGGGAGAAVTGKVSAAVLL